MEGKAMILRKLVLIMQNIIGSATLDSVLAAPK